LKEWRCLRQKKERKIAAFKKGTNDKLLIMDFMKKKLSTKIKN